MAGNTPNLGLYKGTSGSTTETFNVQTMLNDNWDKLDTEVPKKASTTDDGRMSKEDKSKLDGIEAGATNYQHPATHPPSIIEQDANNRFVTDAEKTDWNAKETPAGAQAKVDTHENTATGVHPATAVSIQDTEGHFVASEVEGALHELFTNVSDGKTSIASAITDMGQAASGSDTFATLATKIRDISDDADALVGDVLSSKTFYQGGTKRTGTMPNRGAGGTVTPSTVNQVKSAGYYSSDITILGDSDLVSTNIKAGTNIFGVAGNSNVVDTSPGTAVAGDILSGKVAFVDGVQVTGTMLNRSTGDYAADASSVSSTTLKLSVPDAGYYGDGANITITDADFVAENIRSGKNIFGVAGNLIDAKQMTKIEPLTNVYRAGGTIYSWVPSGFYTILDVTGSGWLLLPFDGGIQLIIDGYLISPNVDEYTFHISETYKPILLRFDTSLVVKYTSQPSTGAIIYLLE